MFWKKRKPSSELFEVLRDERRASFRVKPLETAPVRIHIQGAPITVLDIGAMGVSFFHPSLVEKQSYPATVTLPDHSKPISTDIHIVRKDTRNICHCRFSKLTPHETEAIHKYMLEVQKQAIRKNTARNT